ncbi:MAG TPA: dicarboxylate/amino acid:cation symporter [Pirellulales bacterium]|jgi:DAACS family dicarboxylate/amino acid:cation (Na+ or H+) symporter
MKPDESASGPEGTTSAPPPPKPRGLALHTKILLGLIVGAAAGVAFNPFYQGVVSGLKPGDTHWVMELLTWTDAIGGIFLRLVFIVVLPLVISALALGVLELGDLRRLGRVGLRTLGFTLLFSVISVVIGIGLVNLIRPGDRMSVEKKEGLLKQYSGGVGDIEQKADKAKHVSRTLLDIIPENPLQEMVGAIDGTSKGNGMLAVMFCGLMLGVALAMTTERTGPLVKVLEGLFDVSMTIIGLAMKLAPYCVACLVFGMTARQGGEVLMTLGWFVLTVVLGLSLQMFVVYSLAVAGIARRDPRQFFRDISDAALTAFGTSSSNATLPVSLRVARENLKLPPEISRFVLTVGATGNQNGTALYEGIVVLFLAQVFGVQLSVGDQISVVLMSILAGVGTAGVPGGSIPLIMIVLRSVHVPGEAIAIILGVDRLCDMLRTVLNVSGDLVLATCVAGEETAKPEPPPEAATDSPPKA